MARAREWSDEEVLRLSTSYTSNKTFEEILNEFPARSSNAIRLKASRMGFRRLTIPLNLIQAKHVNFRVNGEDGTSGFLMKCNNCGNWIQVDGLDDGYNHTVSCSDCNSIYQVVNEL